MKFLLMFSLLAGSAFANANPPGHEWEIKCYENGRNDRDLAYIIKVDRENHPTFDSRLELQDCSRGDHHMKEECRERGQLRRLEHRNETCLVLDEEGGRNGQNGHDGLANDGQNGSDGRHGRDSWSLCYQEQGTLVDHRLVPVTVTDDRQNSRVWCERELLRVL